MADVFISYSRRDADFVRRLYTALAADGRDIWVDWEDIPLTADWWREVQAGIEAANAFAFVISPDSVRSEICRREIEHAIANNKRVLPVLHRVITDAADQQLMHPIISSHNWIFFRETDNFDQAFESFKTALDTDLGHVRAHTRLLVRAREWQNNGSNPSFLLRGDNLRDAESWLVQAVGQDPEPLPLHAEYIATSRAAENRRQRSLLAGVSLALVISLALAVIALMLFGEANLQRGIADQNAAIAVQAQGEAENQAQIAQTAQGEAERQAQFAQTQAAIAASARGEAERQRNLAQAQATAVANERNRAQSIGLAGLSQWEQSSPRPERAVLLALEALRVYVHTWQAERALALAVQNSFARQTLNGHRDAVYAPAWSPDSQQVVTASADYTARIWNRDGQQQAVLQHNGIVNRAIWSPDGTRIATASTDRAARLWSAAGAPELTLTGHQGNVFVAIWSPDGTRIATASADRTARVWDAASGEELLRLAGHGDNVNSVAWSPDGARLLTASDDRTARVWDASSGEELLRLAGHEGFVIRAAWSPDGTRIATASADRSARLWDANDGTLLNALPGHLGSVTRVAWSPDGTRLVTASVDNTARIWNADTGEAVHTLFGHTDNVVGVVWSPGGRRVITTSRDRSARLWDADSGAQMLVFTGHADAVYSADWSPDGEYIATASQDGTARLWQTWTTTQRLITFAERCCVPRILTDEERQQFGLPIPPGDPPPAYLDTCPNTLESRLYPGARGEVTDDDDRALRVRELPGLNGFILAQIPPRQTFRVLEGPWCADNMAWFRVIFGINAVQGWIAEGEEDRYYTRPIP